MNSNNTIACPLDCYDTCEATYENGLIKPSHTHEVTNKKLCVNFAHLNAQKNLESAFFNNEKISLKESMDILKDKLKNTKASKTLYVKGSGNIGVMQSYPKTFFSKYGSDTLKGGLCDDIGDHGLSAARGANTNPSLDDLKNADVIICWGRNFSVTSSHMYKLVKNKTFITIDPIVTDIAKKSELHLQINPKTDHELALLLTRFAIMQDLEDEEFIAKHDADDFIDLAKSRPLVSYEFTTGICLSQIAKFIDLIEGKTVALMIGLGVQKYYEGAQIIRCIDSFAALIGLHNSKKKAGGVWYLSNGSYGYEKQLTSSFKNEVAICEVDYSSYDLVFIQGADLLVSNANTLKIQNELKNTFVVYFGISINQTCEFADLIIPSSSFLEKKDIRLSYGHELKAISYKHETSSLRISEFELTKVLFEYFSFDGLKDENEVFDYYKNTKPLEFVLENYNFIEEIEIDNLYDGKKENEFYLITSKAKNNLNSQFKIDNFIYLHPSTAYSNNQEVILSSKYGKARFEVKLSEDVKKDCILIYAGNINGNYLTPALSDELASSAIFQEVLITIDLP